MSQATHPINSVEENDTVFNTTYLGWVEPGREVLTGSSGSGPNDNHQVPRFIGCMQDIVVNKLKITANDIATKTRGVVDVRWHFVQTLLISLHTWKPLVS